MVKKQGDQWSYGKKTRRSMVLCQSNREISGVMSKKQGDQWSYVKETGRSVELC